MTRLVTPKLGAYAGLAALGLFAALGAERPELAALAAPFAVLAALGLVLARPPEVGVEVEPALERVFEGEEVEVAVEVESATGAADLELLVRLPDGLSLADGENPVALRLAPGERRELTLSLRVDRWGGYLLGDVVLRARDPLGLVHHESRLDRRRPLKAYPRPERVDELLQPAQTQVFSGNYVSRERGEGIEFADLRPFAPGDRVRRVNWRASARRGELWVNEYHPERNADVVVFLDTFAEASDPEGSTLDLGVRAASAFVSHYLRHKDRVGFVSFGGRLNWLQPRTGVAQLYRIVDALVDAEIVLNYAWSDVDVIPRHTLPPKALVVALSPLLDERSIAALLDLRGRGFDLAVVEVSPAQFTAPGKGERAELAHRIWLLRREAARARFERAGVAVGTWDETKSLVGALEEVRAFRRFAARAHA
ncbi:MAG: DUF58 domain-containing protein [Gaiellaceae bacterium]